MLKSKRENSITHVASVEVADGKKGTRRTTFSIHSDLYELLRGYVTYFRGDCPNDNDPSMLYVFGNKEGAFSDNVHTIARRFAGPFGLRYYNLAQIKAAWKQAASNPVALKMDLPWVHIENCLDMKFQSERNVADGDEQMAEETRSRIKASYGTLFQVLDKELEWCGYDPGNALKLIVPRGAEGPDFSIQTPADKFKAAGLAKTRAKPKRLQTKMRWRGVEVTREESTNYCRKQQRDKEKGDLKLWVAGLKVKPTHKEIQQQVKQAGIAQFVAPPRTIQSWWTTPSYDEAGSRGQA